MDFQTLIQLNQSGVYALINASKRRVYVGFGTNMLASLSRLVEQFKTNKKMAELAGDVADLELRVLENIETNSVGVLRAKMAVWVRELKKEGYSLYRKYEGMTYKVKKVLDIEGNVVVMLVRPGVAPLVVGVFALPINADLFIRTHYTDKDIIEPVYAKNELTQHYLMRFEK